MAKVLEFPTLTLLLYKFEDETSFFFFFFEQDETRFGRGKGVEGNHHFQINISKEKLQKIHKTCKNFTNILLSTY